MRSSPFGWADRAFAPPPAPARVAFLARPFAHRGLHGREHSENGMGAFAAAIGRGHGIECDVRLGREGEAIVFHDDDLARMTGRAGLVAETGAAEIAALRLPDGTAVPRLRDLLAIVAGRVPLLVELKTGRGGVAPLCLAVCRALEGYRGAVGVMAFDPAAVRWLRRRVPRIVRGLILGEQRARRVGAFRRRIGFWRSAPDFLACDVDILADRFIRAQGARGVPLLAWTVRDAAGLDAARAAGAAPIYEEAAGWTLPR